MNFPHPAGLVFVLAAALLLSLPDRLPAQTILTPPQNQTITAGAVTTFTVMASGIAPVSYQWQKNGTLVGPVTKTQYSARSVPLPPQIFSHSDQQVQWQSSVPDQTVSTGWGGDIYGRMPEWAINGPDDMGRGRWIPTTSVDEYSATLASWFGGSATNLPVVPLYIGRFAKPNLGFLG